MPIIKERTCSVCGRSFLWSIERPGDGFWDRWRNDNGETLGSWFTGNTRCYEHALEVMPEKYRNVIRTLEYEEGELKGT